MVDFSVVSPFFSKSQIKFITGVETLLLSDTVKYPKSTAEGVKHFCLVDGHLDANNGVYVNT